MSAKKLANAAEVRIEVVRDLDGLEALRDVWLAMNPPPNAHPDLVRHVVESRPSVLRPHVIVMRRRERPVALLIGRVEIEPFVCKIGYKKYWSRPTRWLTFVYGGALSLDPDVDWTPLVHSALDSLRAGESRLVAFRFLPTNSRLFALTRTLPPARCSDPDPVPVPHWRLDLPETFAELMARESGKRRKELRRYRRVLEREHPERVTYRRISLPDEVPELCARADQLVRGTYQHALAVGFSGDAVTVGRLRRAAARCALRAYLLEIDGVARSFWIGEVCGDTLYLHFTGFDSAYRKFEVGTVLLLVLLEDAVADGVRAVDYGFGDAFYKRRFDAHTWEEATVHIFAPGLVGMSLRLLRRVSVRVSLWAEVLARRLGIYQRLKTKSRRRMLAKSSDSRSE